MNREQVKPMGNTPRTHLNCLDRYKVARPGKTAVDKRNGSQRFSPNRRVWSGRSADDPAGYWSKV